MNTLDRVYNLLDSNARRGNGDEVSANRSISGSSAVELSAKLESSVKTHILETGPDGGRRVFSRSIESSFSLNISYERPEFEINVPSPSDVANTVLGFVERRIDNEIANGADESRVNELLGQARKGVEAGFASAKEDIEALGLMDEGLESEIDESRSLIDEGIDNIESDYRESIGSSVSGPVSTQEVEEDSDTEQQVAQGSGQQSGLNVYEFFSPERAAPAERQSIAADSISHKFASHESSQFSLKTRDGDVVNISFSESFASVYKEANGAFGLAIAGESAFQFSVEGELDEGELEAINELLSQVGQVADLFFQNRFQEAFSSALNVGFDTSEIAAFSLDLSKAVVEEVRAYGAPSNGNSNSGNEFAAAKRYQPIIDMANHLSKMSELMSSFDTPRDTVAGLVTDTLERVKDMIGEVQERLEIDDRSQSFPSAKQVSVSQLMEFSEYLLLS